MYIMLEIQSEIAFTVSVVSCYRSNLILVHYGAVKRIFQEIKSTKDLQLTYRGDLQSLSSYIDSNWAEDDDT